MSTENKHPADYREVIMRRGDLENLPRYELPVGFALRAYETGDEVAWTEIHRLADKFNLFTPHTFRDVFGHDEHELRARQKYLLSPDGRLIGTATAWFDSADASSDSSQKLGEGRVHWVAIVPEFHGRGLSKPLLSEVLRTLRDLGHSKTVLSTDDKRPVAIALYESFGFQRVT